jgi:light-regulated signal transduction histidine kinase (bacteriophytochrome)
MFIFVLLAVTIFIQTRNNRQLKELNNQLQKRNNALQQFSYIASHDIKEPIRNVGNYISLIRRRLPEAEKERMTDYFDIIDDSLKQTYTLIEDVMQYTQIGQDEKVVMEKTDLNAVVKNVTMGLENYIQERNGQVNFSNLPTIKSSSSLLFLVFKNLIQNGLKFNHSTIPTIKINYENIDNQHIIRIVDNGIGIEEEYHQHIFKMFKRLHTRNEFKGSGLGLAITENIIDKFNGTIEVESSSTNGTIFKITLPKNV